MYTGSGTGVGGGTTKLSRHNLSTSRESILDVESLVLGIAVDQETGLVYLTTYGSGQSPDRFLVYDFYDFDTPQQWVSDDIGSPAGVAVAPIGGSPFLVLTKDDNDVDCVYPFNPLLQNYLNYDICCDANGNDANNVIITDFLPYEVDFHSADSNGVYDSNSRTVTWNIEYIPYGDSNCVQLTVKVNERATPGGTITNYCEVESDEYYSYVMERTNVCCWGGNTIYVDADANGYDNGGSWQHAYTDLQDALKAVQIFNCNCSEIWVAEGTYKPTTDPNDYNATFQLVEAVGLYGGFPPGGGDWNDRNPNTYETTLTGDINNDDNADVYYLVTGADDVVLDGFTITKADLWAVLCNNASGTNIINCVIQDSRGVYCTENSPANITNCQITNIDGPAIKALFNSSLNITNCLIDNSANGIKCEYSSLMVLNTEVLNSDAYGIRCTGSDLVNIINCIIEGSGYDGIHCNASTAIIKNNWICGNDGHSSNGLRLYAVDSLAVIRNNTFANNNEYGIMRSGGVEPNISNCIIWGNVKGNLDGTFGDVTYSCIQDCDYAADPHMHNICADPCFVDDENGDYHLDPNSPCINTGDPNADYNGETDIDGEFRVVNGRVDMGADEYPSPADFNDDGIVNFFDYAPFAAAWLTDDPNYSLDDDNDVDINDLALFCGDWLWIAGWAQSEWMMMG